MSSLTGFQANSTISDAFWIFKPDPSDKISREVIINISQIQLIQATQDHNKVWLYCAANNSPTTQEPYILEGPVAQAFLSSLEALFS
jgi:hypothetical protein